MRRTMTRNRLAPIALVWLVVFAFVSAPALSEPPGTIESDTGSTIDEAIDQLAYSIGFQVGSDFRRMGRPLDPDQLVAGLRDALDRAEPRLSASEMQEALGEIPDGEAGDAGRE